MDTTMRPHRGTPEGPGICSPVMCENVPHECRRGEKDAEDGFGDGPVDLGAISIVFGDGAGVERDGGGAVEV